MVTLLPPGSVVIHASAPMLGRPLAPPMTRPAYVPNTPEYVSYQAPCDLCGTDAEWTTERDGAQAQPKCLCPCAVAT